MTFQTFYLLTTNIACSVTQELLASTVIAISNWAATVRTILHRILFLIVMGALFQVRTSAAPFVDSVDAGTIVRSTNLTALNLQVLNPSMGFGISAVMLGRLTIIFFRLLNLAADINPTGFLRWCNGGDRLFRLLSRNPAFGGDGLLRVALNIDDAGDGSRERLSGGCG